MMRLVILQIILFGKAGWLRACKVQRDLRQDQLPLSEIER
jgi:hypothetical protein